MFRQTSTALQKLAATRKTIRWTIAAPKPSQPLRTVCLPDYRTSLIDGPFLVLGCDLLGRPI